MKLLRFGPTGGERPGLLDEAGKIRDLSGHIADIAGQTLSDGSLEAIRQIEPNSLPEIPDGVRIGPCVGNVGKFLCIGLNYRDHAEEAGMPIPSEPILFMKATSAIIGPNDAVVIPKGSVKTDWEVELGVVIGSRSSHVSVAEALSHVAGYCTVNDLSERAYQLERGGQWDKGKGCDTFGPIGPWLVTREELPDPQALNMWLDVDGVRQQTGNTATMIFSVAELVSYCSKFMTLHPGDIISTGTPPGVGMGKKGGGVFLRPGQVIKLGIDKLGAQTQRTVPFPG